MANRIFQAVTLPIFTNSHLKYSTIIYKFSVWNRTRYNVETVSSFCICRDHFGTRRWDIFPQFCGNVSLKLYKWDNFLHGNLEILTQFIMNVSCFVNFVSCLKTWAGQFVPIPFCDVNLTHILSQYCFRLWPVTGKAPRHHLKCL